LYADRRFHHRLSSSVPLSNRIALITAFSWRSRVDGSVD
jgi:hypothetical protein